MADKHELENLMRSTMENLRDMIDVNTVVGDVVEVDFLYDTYIIS